MKNLQYFLNEGMLDIKPAEGYEKFNLKHDGIHPKEATTVHDSIVGIQKGDRRVAWVDLTKEEAENLRGVGILKMYDDLDSKVAKAKIKKLSQGGWGLKGATLFVDREYLIYMPNYKDQALEAKKEFMRRGGWWTENGNTAEQGIYLARLMGYGEEYIVPHIKKYYPSFDVEKYIEKNPRNKTLAP